ncbi:uncharacterized protein TrAtP1_000840 [Trichoderma atroviride]|uniref:uncharacterized protein n=1 Tax=Hypocrea atroviridis TaxID=63577 RepID=UPI00332D0C33|nr:hypothetical protein TrAtP1_000840 [Trichoderma atroviride]
MHRKTPAIPPRLGLVAVPALHAQRLLPILVSQSGFRWPRARAQQGRTQGTALEDGQGGGSFVRCSVRGAPAWYLSASIGQARAASTEKLYVQNQYHRNALIGNDFYITPKKILISS